MTECIFVYITASSEAEAIKIARTLVEEKLAACVNIHRSVCSIYRWEERVDESREAVLIVKTKAALFGKIEDRVKALHSYSCPCIVAQPVSMGSQECLKWIVQSTL